MPKTTTPEPDTTTSAPAEPDTTPALIVGSNLGHAQRHAERRGLPKTAAVAVDKANEAINNLPEGSLVILAKPTADKAANWRVIQEMVDKAKGTTQIDPNP